MLKEYLPNIKFICLYAALLFPMTAYASFNASPCRNFTCEFLVFGVLFGILGGIPISILMFVGLHISFCNRERSKVNQALLGGLNGIIAFEVSSCSAALIAIWRDSIFSLEIGFTFTYLLFAIISLLYASSNPRI